jgi:hypothetical protein
LSFTNSLAIARKDAPSGVAIRLELRPTTS